MANPRMLDINSLLGDMEVQTPSPSSLILSHSCWKQAESVHETALRISLSEPISHLEVHLATERSSSTPGQQRPRANDPIYNG